MKKKEKRILDTVSFEPERAYMQRSLIGFAMLVIAVGISFFMLYDRGSRKRVVHVYNWSDYFNRDVLDDFSRETGIEVVYDVFDSNEILETRLLAGGSGYDIVVPSGQFLARQIRAGVFQKLDLSKLPNRSHMWDVIERKVAFHDPGNQYSINYMWGTTGIGYNRKKIREHLGTDTLKSWDSVLKVENLKKLQKCGVYFLDQAQDIVPIVLNYMGLDPNSRDEKDLLQAENLLMSLRPFIRRFNSSEYMDALASGDICVAIGWSGDILQARKRAREAKRGVDVAYALPIEGSEVWFDQMAIPADAKNIDEAYEFMNFMMKPEVIARISNHIYYANGNLASHAFLNKDILEDKAVYPDISILETLYTVMPFDPETQRKVTRSWTRVTSGQ